ncbi:MAG: surface lipoprotein assembly modifier [Sulfuritalea sp.]|nr:surface lipoprotein assembly modifier [Sulfuritalea sp.]
MALTMLLVLFANSSMANKLATDASAHLPTSTIGTENSRRDCPVTGDADADAQQASPSSITMAYIHCLIERGHPALAILLLQQLLAAEESNQDAALLLAEQLGKAQVPQAKPGASVPQATSPPITGWLAAEFGHDSNINRATNAKVIDIPLLNYRSLELPDLLVEKRSSFAGLQGGATARLSLTQNLAATVHAQAGLRANFAETSYLPHNYFASAQLDYAFDPVVIGVGATVAQQWLAKYQLLDRRGLRAQATTKTVAGIHVSVNVESAQNTYPLFENLATRENSVELRASYSPFGVHVGAYRGEEASRGAIKDLDRNFDGFSIGWRYPLSERWRLAVDVSSGRSAYTQFSRLFGTRRNDRQRDASIALHIRLRDDWSITPRLTLEQNESSVTLNGYRRTQYLAELRKDF